MSRANPGLSMPKIFGVWWPLAASWILMTAELPVLSAVIARLPSAAVNLAAFGGVVFPLAVFIASPVSMFLAASVALSTDRGTFRILRRYMMRVCGLLTLLHIAVAFTPLYDLVVIRFIHPPEDIIELARTSLRMMTPWTWAIGYRRFNQGALIRLGQPRAIGAGAVIRLTTDGLVLGAGYVLGMVGGATLASLAMSCGVVVEAAYSRMRLGSAQGTLPRAESVHDGTLTGSRFLQFYIPLATTSVLFVSVQPIASAALSRMPNPLVSLAVWPVVYGLVRMMGSLGLAYSEVVISLVESPGAVGLLHRFAALLGGLTTAIMILVVVTPLARFWFDIVSGLSAPLASLARNALWMCLPVPSLMVVHNWYQGLLVHSRRTREVTGGLLAFLLTYSLVLMAGAEWGKVPGVYFGALAFGVGASVQAAWLWARSKPVIRALQVRGDTHICHEWA